MPKARKMDSQMMAREADLALNSLAEFLSRQFQAQGRQDRYSDPNLSVHDINMKLHSDFDLIRQRLRNGYHVLLREVRKLLRQKEDTNIKPYLPTERALENVLDDKRLDKQLRQQLPLSQILGISDDAILIFYDIARFLLEGKRTVDSSDAFYCLTTLCPQVGAFWIGLGRSESSNAHFEQALMAYQVAIMINEVDPYPYLEAAHCCVEISRYDWAESILSWAETYAKEHVNLEGSTELLACAQNAKVELQQLRR